MDQQKKELLEVLSGAEKVLIGTGGEWKLRDDDKDVRQRCLGGQEQKELRETYTALWSLIRDKDYYMTTTVMDGAVYDMDFDNGRVVIPCGNTHWRQCSKTCTKDIWEEGEVLDDICPHCKAPLTGNTADAETYIKEGYLPRWEAYKRWQTRILSRRPVILELGEGLKAPAVMRWPFERVDLFSQESMFYRIHRMFYRMPKEMRERTTRVQTDSVAFIRDLAEDREEYQNYFITTMPC